VIIATSVPRKRETGIILASSRVTRILSSSVPSSQYRCAIYRIFGNTDQTVLLNAQTFIRFVAVRVKRRSQLIPQNLVSVVNQRQSPRSLLNLPLVKNLLVLLLRSHGINLCFNTREVRAVHFSPNFGTEGEGNIVKAKIEH